jgi:pentose-5-phosphate-3-epimerase
MYEVIDSIKKNGMKAGIAINPDTDVNVLEEFIKDIDLVIVMGVFPGFSGQSFILFESIVKNRNKSIDILDRRKFKITSRKEKTINKM